MRKSKEKKSFNIAFSRLKRRVLKHTTLIRVLIIASTVVLFFYFTRSLYQYAKENKIEYYLSLAKHFVLAPSDQLKKDEGKTNILLLGKGGEGHEAPDLTDSIMLMSVDDKQKEVNLISLPRDIWVENLRIKINSLYYWGNKRNPNGGGMLLAETTLEEILGVPIHYTMILDFSSFKEIIDYLGGIEIDVERPFVDKRYPIKGKENDDCSGDIDFSCRYEAVKFKKGIQEMNGETALKFVRSRNAEGDEGTDIARAKRQQKVLEAIKEKVIKKENFLNPKRLVGLFEIITETLETDMKDTDLAIISRHVFDSRDNIKRHNIPEELLLVPDYQEKYDNLYVFVPASGGWEEVQKWVDSVIDH